LEIEAIGYSEAS